MSLCVISLLTSSICTAVYCCIYILISHKSDKKICEIPKRPSVKVNDCVLYKGDVIFYDGQFWSVEKICEEQLLLKKHCIQFIDYHQQRLARATTEQWL